MTFYKIVLIAILLTGCGSHKSRPTVNAFEHVKEKSQFYLKYLSLDNAAKSRCDGITFRAIYDTIKPEKRFLDHEYPSGKLNRDYAKCYPNDSRSEISREGYINTLHTILSRRDLGFLNRLISYAEKRFFVVGLGSYEYTDIKILAPVMYELRDHLEGKKRKDQKSLGIFDGILDALIKDYSRYLSEYRGAVVASYIYLRGRINGELSNFEFQTLKLLKKANPYDPYFLALYSRFLDGDQTKAIEILANDEFFPGNSLWSPRGLAGKELITLFYFLGLSVSSTENNVKIG